ncbi:MAG: ribulose-phosphate 3-epimerase [Clostridia bacterium]|nr:ribulose-phosphate 3-epimerase [Clostridia bacterium]
MIATYAETNGGILISPSILSADFSALADDVRKVEQAADWLHIDVMDGVFVPNITIGPPVVRALRGRTRLPLDVHLMIIDPDRYVETFAQAGADLITVHAEACTHLDRVLQHIRSLGIGAGVSLNPATPLAQVEEVLDKADLVLLMTVNPGFGGQKYIQSMTDKIRRLRAMMEESGHMSHIQVDGGIGPGNIADIYKAGADVIVAGNSVYGAADPAAAIRELRRLACGH